MFYDNEDVYFDTLTFDDCFTSASDFITKMVSVGGITNTDDLTELYEILALKYVGAHTRYTTAFPFQMAIKRELYTEFPFYLEKKELAAEMMAIEIAEVQVQQKQLRNLVDTHDEPIANADSVAIDDLSTQQENIRVTNNKLEAIKAKYNTMNRDYLRQIYNKCDGLFRQILYSDKVCLYEEV